MLLIIRPYKFNLSSSFSGIFQSGPNKVTSQAKVGSCCVEMYPFDSRSYLTSFKASRSDGKPCHCAFTSSELNNSMLDFQEGPSTFLRVWIRCWFHSFEQRWILVSIKFIKQQLRALICTASPLSRTPNKIYSFNSFIQKLPQNTPPSLNALVGRIFALAKWFLTAKSVIKRRPQTYM